MKTEIIRTENLFKNYLTGKTEVPVLKDLNLKFYEGEFSVIMGNSGSGKSTLLYLLSGLDGITSGGIWINDEPIHEKTEKSLALFRRKNIGFVFQDHNLIPNLSLLENILVAGYLSTKSRSIIYQRALGLLKELEIDSYADLLPSQVSGGERQRCAIARSLINSPALLFADEPTGNLNSASSIKALECFKNLNTRGQTVIMVTHDLKTACTGDRILFFRDGQVIDTFYFERGEDLTGREAALFSWLKERGW